MPRSPSCKRGDVVLVLYPNSNLLTSKLRPALVIQADNLKREIPQIILAMITSRMLRANHPSRVTVLRNSEEGQRSGLLSDSVVMTDNVATVLESAVSQVIGTLTMRSVDNALRHTLALSVS